MFFAFPEFVHVIPIHKKTDCLMVPGAVCPIVFTSSLCKVHEPMVNRRLIFCFGNEGFVESVESRHEPGTLHFRGFCKKKEEIFFYI